MKELSRISEQIRPSLTRKLFNMAKQYDDVIDFTLGDPDVPTPLPIKEAGCKAIMEGKTRYSQNAGLLELREAIAYKCSMEDNLVYDPKNEIIVTVGAMEGLYLALLALLNEGDEVIIPAPYYVNYKQMVLLCHGTPIVVESNSRDKLRFDIAAISDAITPNTKAIILNTPCNPTGKIMSQQDIATIAEVAKANDLFVITDEVYKCLIYDSKLSGIKSIATLPEMQERTIMVNSFSKEFCMTGWRVGYVFAPEPIISIMTKFQENVVACAPLPSQYAAIEALKEGMDYSKEMVEIFRKRRDVLLEELLQTDKLQCNAPDATFYAMIDISKTALRSEEFAYALLKAVHVAVVPGITYGQMCDNYVRLAFTLHENKIREGIKRLVRFVKDISL